MRGSLPAAGPIGLAATSPSAVSSETLTTVSGPQAHGQAQPQNAANENHRMQTAPGRSHVPWRITWCRSSQLTSSPAGLSARTAKPL